MIYQRPEKAEVYPQNIYINANLMDLAFIDIETASQYDDLEILGMKSEELSCNLKPWLESLDKVKLNDEDITNEMYLNKACLSPVYGKVVCISLGLFLNKTTFRVYSFARKGDNNSLQTEKELLADFAYFVNNLQDKRPNLNYVGHYIKNFDIPFIQSRMLVHNLYNPLQGLHVKPWESKVFDTFDMWGQGKNLGAGKLGNLCALFGIQSPKDEFDGSMVSKKFHNGGIEEIVTYCEKDVIATKVLFFKLNQST